MNGWLLGIPNTYVGLRKQQQAGRIKSQGTLWMVIDHQALAPSRFSLLHQVSDTLQMYTLERLVGCWPF